MRSGACLVAVKVGEALFKLYKAVIDFSYLQLTRTPNKLKATQANMISKRTGSSAYTFS